MRTGLDQKTHIRVVFYNVMDLQDIVHRLPGILDGNIISGEDLCRLVVIALLWFIEYPAEGFV